MEKQNEGGLCQALDMSPEEIGLADSEPIADITKSEQAEDQCADSPDDLIKSIRRALAFR